MSRAEHTKKFLGRLKIMKKEYRVNVVMFGGPERLACIVLSNSLKNAVRQIKARPPFSMRSTYYIFEAGKYAEGVSITC